MLTQEKFDQGLDENCNLEQGDADFPEEIEFPLYDFLHKTAIWSLSTTLKEELAKYKRNVIQPAVTPLLILLIERAPSYEENMERVNKMLDEDIKNFQILTKPGKNESGKNLENITFEARSTRTPFQSRFQQIEVFVAQQQALGKTTAAEIYNAYKAFDPAGELCLISGPRHVQYILDRQRRLKQVRETSNNVDARLSRPYQKRPKENITFEARSTRTPFQSTFKQFEVYVAQQQALGKTTAAEIYNAYKATDPACELRSFVGPRNPRIVQYILDRQRRLKQVQETSNNVDARLSCPYQKRPKEIQVDVAEQQNCGKRAEIYKFIMANAPAAELLSINRPRNRRQQQLVLDRQRRLEQSRGQGSKCGTSPFTTLVNFTLLGNKSEMVSYADDSTTFLK
jgi:hypothetical protein